MTPTLKLLNIVWESGSKDSWDRVNTSMRNALELAIGSAMQINRADLVAVYHDFRGTYWMSENSEWVYSMAIAVGNVSAIEAYEQYKGRKPFRANDVHLGYQLTHGYIHRHNPARGRERVAVGFTFPLDGFRWKVNGFNDEKGIVRFARYEKEASQPKELRKATNEEFSALFPAPKKSKKEAV